MVTGHLAPFSAPVASWRSDEGAVECPVFWGSAWGGRFRLGKASGKQGRLRKVKKEAKAPEEEVPEDAQGTGPSSQDLPLQT